MSTYTQSASNSLFATLPEDIRQRFYALASRSETTAQEWYHHEIPDQLKTDAEGIDILLNGGEVTVDGVTHTIEAHQFSRIQSGANGGEYTPDNVVLEGESDNLARSSNNMSVEDQISTEIELDSTADIIISRDTAEVATTVTETSTAVDGTIISAAEASDGILDTVLEGILPVTVGAKLAHSVWTSETCKHMDVGEKTAVTALGGGVGVLGTVAVVSNPVGATCVALYGAWKLANLATKLANRYS